MGYYNRPSGASYDDPMNYRMKVPGLISFIGILITIGIVVLLIVYTDIKWGWYLLIFPCLAGIIIGILNTPNRSIQSWLTWIVCIIVFALSFVVIGFLGGPAGGVIGAIVVTLLVGSGLSNSYRTIRNNYSYADEVVIEQKKRHIQERFKGKKVY